MIKVEKILAIGFAVVVIAWGALWSSSPVAAERPNIVLIVADDLGYSDVGFNGCKEIPTENLDALADAGVVFSSGYASHPYCSPSRAGLLTGRYQQRFGHECNPLTGNEVNDASAPGLPLSETTLADVLAEAGYVTGAIGKWHLGDAKRYWPTRRGFQQWFGFSGGGFSYWGELGNKDPLLGVHRGEVAVSPDSLTYLTDDFSSEAVNFVKRHRDDAFFLYLAYNAPHAPDQAPRRHLAKTQHIEYGGRAVYGAMVAAMDEGIGRVMQQLQASGVADNTLVIFLSDNGGRRQHAMNFPYRGHKGMLFEGGIRVPFVITWPAELPQGVRQANPVTALDLFPTILAAADIDKSLDLDGINLLPLLRNPQHAWPDRNLFWRYAMGDGTYGYAVREGAMKLVDSRYKDRKLLFDLGRDPWEQRDLAADRPQAVTRLSKLIERWDAENIAPRWTDPHGVNVLKEEAERTEAIERAARGERR